MIPLLTPSVRADSSEEIWDPLSQPWAQFSRTPMRDSPLPPHSPDGGPQDGSPVGITEFGTIEEPVINWQALEGDTSVDSYGSVIGDFSGSISAPEAAKARCGEHHLFTVITYSRDVGGTMHSILAIIEGDTSKVAWESDLGETKSIRATPVIHDVNDDGAPEIIVAYDTDSSANVELWSPILTCSESGWSTGQHSNEKVWTWSEVDYRFGITSPHWPTRNSGHLSTTQPLLADLNLDGGPELVLALVDEDSDDPVVVALPLDTTGAPDPDWSVVLDRGTHPSDPTWTALDSSSSAVVLTTIDSNSGSMWIWRINGATGSMDWGERVAIQGTDGDSDAPRLRLPGPVIAQLDGDDAMEMILTIPTDANGRDSGHGARFIGMELTSTDTLFNFRTPNGYADAPPLPMDTDGDGQTDRLCWVTWYSASSASFERKGLAGCHDLSTSTPIKEWSRTLTSSGGTNNDQIAVSQPIAVNLDGQGVDDLVIAYGKRLWAFDGDSGASADINTHWSSPINLPHRTWATPAVADMDGDGFIDILIGDVLISNSKADLAPLSDGRGIGFTPIDPDPGEMVTISGLYSNIGTAETDEPVTAILYLNGEEIARHRADTVPPVAPTGEGGPVTFSAEITAELGHHQVELVVDAGDNVTQSRMDNDVMNATLSVVEPYVAELSMPPETTRIAPGSTQSVSITITATGKESADWSLTWDDANMPEGWSIQKAIGQEMTQNLEPGIDWKPEFNIGIPMSALGDESTNIPFTITLDSDQSISFSKDLHIEVLRTRGLDVSGPLGDSITNGIGRPGNDAKAWLMVENLGNAQEQTSSIQWSSNTWDSTPQLLLDGTEIFDLNLAPGEIVELEARIAVPQGTPLGESSSSELEICIGDGEDSMCEEMIVNMSAGAVESNPPHIRTIPAQGLSWSISASLPSSGELRWDMASAGMLREGWVWQTSGELSRDGNELVMTGSGSASGVLALDLPEDATPNRHTFISTTTDATNSDLHLSLHILQVYRTSIEIISPTEETTKVNVTEAQKILLRLRNPGNGQDVFSLKVSASNYPGVLIDQPESEITLDAGAMTIVSRWITLPEDTPAREPITILFEWDSIADSSVGTQATLELEARPDYRWQLNFTQEDFKVLPGEEFELNIALNNSGNANGTLEIQPSFTTTHVNGDQCTWSAQSLNSSFLEVNQSESLTLSFMIPEDCWMGTKSNLSLDLISDNISTGMELIGFEVKRQSGWMIDLSDADLIIPPSGGEITVQVIALGNTPVSPWFQKAGHGWNLSMPNNLNAISPGNNASLTINVTPDDNALAGQIGLVSIIVSDGDGSGSTTEVIPVRVGSEPGILISSKGDWNVSSAGGMPTAWVSNTGNDVAIINISVNGLPNDWQISGEGILTLAPGSTAGIPVWINGSGGDFQVIISIEHPTLGVMTHEMMVRQSSNSWIESPVIEGDAGSLHSIAMYNGQNSAVSITLNEGFSNVSNENLWLHLIGHQQPIASANCAIVIDTNSLGITASESDLATCVITSANAPLSASVTLISDRGELIAYQVVSLDVNTNLSINLTNQQYSPEPGNIEFTLLVVDSQGRTISSTSKTATAHSSGWNIGIGTLSGDGEVRVGISRTGYERLDGTPCFVELSHESGWTQSKTVDIAGAEFAPILIFYPPSSVDDGTQIIAKVTCDSPFDVDDDPSDDEKSVTWNVEQAAIVESSDLLWSGGIVLLILTIAWFLGIIGPSKVEWIEEEEIKEPKKEVKVRKSIDKQAALLKTEQLSQPAPERVKPEPESQPRVIDDDSASGRLASLRTELTSDDNPTANKEGLNDRMEQFFNK